MALGALRGRQRRGAGGPCGRCGRDARAEPGRAGSEKSLVERGGRRRLGGGVGFRLTVFSQVGLGVPLSTSFTDALALRHLLLWLPRPSRSGDAYTNRLVRAVATVAIVTAEGVGAARRAPSPRDRRSRPRAPIRPHPLFPCSLSALPGRRLESSVGASRQVVYGTFQLGTIFGPVSKTLKVEVSNPRFVTSKTRRESDDQPPIPPTHLGNLTTLSWKFDDERGEGGVLPPSSRTDGRVIAGGSVFCGGGWVCVWKGGDVLSLVLYLLWKRTGGLRVDVLSFLVLFSPVAILQCRKYWLDL